MNAIRLAVSLAVVLTSLGGCDRPAPDGPPTVRLGDSVCAQCNMIISDDRWATATVVQGLRGPEARLFDDFNCQVDFEAQHPDATVLARWSHSHATQKWIRTESGHFLISPDLRTPMGSSTAAFATPEEAQAAKAEFGGETMTFEVAWRRLGRGG